MSTLYLSQVKKTLPIRINKGISTESIKHLLENPYNDVYDFDVFLPSKGKNLQRPLVWSLIQKQEFILSVLKGIKIADISWIRYRKEPGSTETVTYKIIDGKQRITTLFEFCNNGFHLNVDGTDYYFRDFSPEAKYVIDSFEFTVNEAYEYDYDMISDEDKIAWFEMINFAGTPQDIEHLNNLKK